MERLGAVPVAEQVRQRIRKPLRLEHARAVDLAASADDRIAGAHQHRRIGIHRSRARPEFAGEAVVQAVEVSLPRVAQVEVREQAPHRDR
jgi:hypothetical protein